jgi:hypothetical protein
MLAHTLVCHTDLSERVAVRTFIADLSIVVGGWIEQGEALAVDALLSLCADSGGVCAGQAVEVVDGRVEAGTAVVGKIDFAAITAEPTGQDVLRSSALLSSILGLAADFPYFMGKLIVDALTLDGLFILNDTSSVFASISSLASDGLAGLSIPLCVDEG